MCALVTSSVISLADHAFFPGLQHDHHRPAVLHNQPTTLHNNATVSGHLHQAHLEAKVPPGSLHLQQFNQPKPVSLIEKLLALLITFFRMRIVCFDKSFLATVTRQTIFFPKKELFNEERTV